MAGCHQSWSPLTTTIVQVRAQTTTNFYTVSQKTRTLVTRHLSVTSPNARPTLATRNAWQSLAYSPLGAIVSPPSEYLLKTLTY